MFYLFYNEDGRIFATQEGGIANGREHICVDDLPDDVFNKAVVDGNIVDHIKTTQELAEELKNLQRQNKQVRNQRLYETDWTQVADSPLSNEKKAQWAVYRQHLRDITNNPNWPELNHDDWPIKPS